MMFTRLSAAAVLVGILTLGGCALVAPPQYYQLDSGATQTPKPASGIAVLVGPLQVADYLQRGNGALVEREVDNSLKINRQAHWAGNLGENIGQVLQRQMASRLKSGQLVLYPDNAGFTPDVQVMVDIDRLDAGPQQPAVLEAQWRILDRTGKMQDSQVVRLQQPHGGSTAEQVKAQSQLLQQFAATLSRSVETVNAKVAAAEKAQRKAETAQAERPKSEAIPMVEPVKAPVEVFRF